jgi:cyclic 2,3-diphosphoglycerate synthetase
MCCFPSPDTAGTHSGGLPTTSLLTPTGRVVVLVDGEHSPSVIRAALDALSARGASVVGAALLGGTEKVRDPAALDVGVPVVAGPGPVQSLVEALQRFRADTVMDLSDEPVVDDRLRSLLAGHALARGVTYQGADFVYTPPPRPRVATKPTIAVIGTGKRTGKTTIAQAIARTLAARGCAPVIVTMARGGPPGAELVVPGASDLTPAGLLERAARGEHAASDHLEDALMAGVPAIGTRRCGGGVAGTPAFDAFAEGVQRANERPEAVLVLEGSGSAIPPVHADVTVCAVPVGGDLELVTGHVGVARLLLSDLVVGTLGDDPGRAGRLPSKRNDSGLLPQRNEPEGLRERGLESRVYSVVPGTPVVFSNFRPVPLEPLHARRVFLATTASDDVAPALARRLEVDHGAVVAGWSTNLANRERLRADLEDVDADVLVTEVKGAGIDTAAKTAFERGMHVVFLRHDVELNGESFTDRVARLADLARARFEGAGREEARR